MSTQTRIEWADLTWNALLGCERVSAGCDGCYAINTATIRAGHPNPKISTAFAGLTERRDGRLDWTGRINLLPGRLADPLKVRKPQRIFVNSQSDLFHKDVPETFIAQVFAVMAMAPQHTFQLLTKRHCRMRSLLNSPSFRIQVLDQAYLLAAGEVDGVQVPRRVAAEYQRRKNAVLWDQIESVIHGWPLPNLHVGVSVEDQKTADLRIPALLGTPAAVRWLSMEPLLGHVDLSEHLAWTRPVTDPLLDAPDGAHIDGMERVGGAWERRASLGWVVVGGETGPKSRPMELAWVRDLRDQVTAAGTPFFLKQWGDHVPPSQMPADTFMDWDVVNGTSAWDRDRPWRVVRGRAGRELDGRTWDEFPAAVVAVPA